MCGFAGAVRFGDTADVWTGNLVRMGATIRHRGPDDHGSWFDESVGVGFAHTRLSILDLSPEGSQPMVSASGRYVIAYNGEAYNFRELREELGGDRLPWRGHSDTEVILAAMEAWGVQEAVSRLVGMFAFAVWDRSDRVLWLVRDRLGIKPVYYGRCGETFLFGSELKALRAHPAFDTTLDRDALALYLRFNYVPAPYSIYRGIRKLDPGHLLRLPVPGDAEDHCYWDAAGRISSARSSPFEGSDEDAVEALDGLLRDSVGRRMVADVPLGAFLSAGVDSSTVVSLMQAQSNRPVRTFTIGFEEELYNEAPAARRIAEHLGTDHTEMYVTPRQALETIPRMPEIFDEPFADSSQVPTFLVSELTRRHVTVSLSGDGGDELFAGYTRYQVGRELWGATGWIPRPVRSAMAGALRATPKRLLDVSLGWLVPLVNRYRTPGTAGDKIYKVADILAHAEAEDVYLDLLSHWKRPNEIVPGSNPVPTRHETMREGPLPDSLTERMMALDLGNYLPDDILVKVDRASMAVSLEARVPILDHRVVEFSWRLPLSMKFRGGKGKWILRQVLHKYVPEEMMDRPKTGFGVPIDRWLRGPLRPWAEDLLEEGRMRREGYFDAAAIRTKWGEHLSGERDWHYYLWDVLMFQAWLDAQGGVR